MRRNKSDNVFTGILWGILLPSIAFGVLSWIWYELAEMDVLYDEDFSPGFRTRTLGLLSIGANLILIRYFQNRYAHQTVRGILIPTFIFVIFWVIYFARIFL